MPSALRSSASVRAVLLLWSAASLVACGTSATTIVENPDIHTDPPVPISAPPPIPIIPEPEPPPPLPPPVAPKGSIEARSLYPQIGLADWTLANGLRVVFKRLESDGFAVRSMTADMPGFDTEAVGTLEEVIDHAANMAGLGATFVVIVGPADLETAEGWAGGRLNRWRGPAPDGAVVMYIPSVSLGWDELAASFVLRAAIADRGLEEARADIMIAHQSLQIFATSGDILDAALRPLTDAEARAARDAIEVDAALWAETLAFLYAERGDFRPAHRPEAAADLLDRLGAVPPSAVNALLDRLRAAAPDPLD